MQSSARAARRAAKRIFAKTPLRDLNARGRLQASRSSLTRPIVRDLTNYPKVEVETRLIRLAVLLTFVVLTIPAVIGLFVLWYWQDLAVSVLASVLFMPMTLYLCLLIVSGYTDYKIKKPSYYASHDL